VSRKKRSNIIGLEDGWLPVDIRYSRKKIDDAVWQRLERLGGLSLPGNANRREIARNNTARRRLEYAIGGYHYYSDDAEWLKVKPKRFNSFIIQAETLLHRLAGLHKDAKTIEALASGLQGQFKSGQLGRKAVHRKLREHEKAVKEVLAWLRWAKSRVHRRVPGPTPSNTGALDSLIRILDGILFDNFPLLGIWDRKPKVQKILKGADYRAFALTAARIVRPKLSTAVLNKAIAKYKNWKLADRKSYGPGQDGKPENLGAK
jgi:hypothetical protein